MIGRHREAMYNTDLYMNPFTFGALAQDEAFIDR